MEHGPRARNHSTIDDVARCPDPTPTMALRRLDPRDLPAESPLAAILRPRGAPISIEHDGTLIDAFDGEPLAIALLAAGVKTLARSSKFHRPRGPTCLRANCDGCLTRIDGVPNVMACRSTAHAGARVESQNAYPTASLDVLRVTDWFFPKQFDHHHLMVQFGGALNRTMLSFARRMSGLGTLPEHPGPVPDVERVSTDVLVAGAGPAGLAAAATVARAGFSVLLCDEEPEIGGTLQDEPGWLAGAIGTSGPRFAEALLRAAERSGVSVRTSACVSATFDNATLVISPERATRVEAKVRVFANGTHEVIPAFESNDMPGVYTARAGARALRHGVLLGRRCVIVGSAWPAAPLERALRDAGAEVTAFPDGTLEGVDGRGAVSHARVKRGRAVTKVRCEAVLVADGATPAFELFGQAGVAINPEPARACFGPRANDDGSTARRDVFAAGSVRGVDAPFTRVNLAEPLASDSAVADGARVGGRVVAALKELARAGSHEVQP